MTCMMTVSYTHLRAHETELHSNQELDDLYDEYDIPFYDEEDEKDQ